MINVVFTQSPFQYCRPAPIFFPLSIRPAPFPFPHNPPPVPLIIFLTMINSRMQKCKSSSKNLPRQQSSPFPNKTSITATKPIEQSYKKLASIGMVSKSTLSKQLFKENKQNYLVRKQQKDKDKDLSVTNNSEYIRSLYRKYLGKDELDSRNLKTDVKEVTAKDLQINFSGNQNTSSRVDSVERIRRDSRREGNGKVEGGVLAGTIKSFTKKESNEERKRPEDREDREDREWELLVSLGDPEDSCIRALKLLKKASKKSSTG